MYDADWTGLKKYETVHCHANTAAKDVIGSDTVHLNCDLCEQQNAVCYCVDCEQKLCDDHFKICANTIHLFSF